MSTNEKISWKRLATEVVAIVGSILLAFAIDAWWEERQDRQTERDDLEQLHVEFVLDRDRVNDNGTATRAANATSELKELLLSYIGEEDVLDVPNELLRGVKATPTFDSVTPVLDGLILSGRLEKIRSQEVRSAISNWQRWIQQVEETELGARQFVQAQLIPALTKRGNMGLVFGERLYSDKDVELEGMTSVRVDEELVGLVANRQANTKFIITALDNLRIAANDVVVAIELELGD